MTPATLTRDEALKRLAGCRELQPGRMQILVGREIVDALLESHGLADTIGADNKRPGDAPTPRAMTPKE